MSRNRNELTSAVAAVTAVIAMTSAAIASKPVNESLTCAAGQEQLRTNIAAQNSVRGFLGERTLGNTIRPLRNETLFVEVYRGGRMIQRVNARTGSDGRFSSQPSGLRSGDSVKVMTQRRFMFTNGLRPITWYGVHPRQTANVQMIYFR